MFDPVAAKAAGGLPEELAPVPSTVELSSTSTSTGSRSSMMVMPTTAQGGGNQKKKSNAGAIAGGVIGGLLALAAIGVGVWIFLRRRALAQRDGHYSSYIKVSTGAPMSEQGISPSHPRLYVRLFVNLSGLFVLIEICRTRPIRRPTPATSTTTPVHLIRPRLTTVITPVPRNCRQSRGILDFLCLDIRISLRSDVVIYCFVVPLMSNVLMWVWRCRYEIYRTDVQLRVRTHGFKLNF